MYAAAVESQLRESPDSAERIINSSNASMNTFSSHYKQPSSHVNEIHITPLTQPIPPTKATSLVKPTFLDSMDLSITAQLILLHALIIVLAFLIAFREGIAWHRIIRNSKKAEQDNRPFVEPLTQTNEIPATDMNDTPAPMNDAFEPNSGMPVPLYDTSIPIDGTAAPAPDPVWDYFWNRTPPGRVITEVTYTSKIRVKYDSPSDIPAPAAAEEDNDGVTIA